MLTAVIIDNDFRTLLLAEMKRRQAKNPAYSLTAFARDLQMSAQKLSQVLSKKIGLSPDSSVKVAERLNLSPEEQEEFVCLVTAYHSRSPKRRAEAATRLVDIRSRRKFKKLAGGDLIPLANWHLWAAYLLTEVADFRSDFDWISERLGVSVEICEKAYDQLLTGGYLAADENGRWVQTEQKLEFDVQISTAEIRAFYRQLLDRAEKSLDHQPVSSRHFHFGLLPIHRSDYDEFKSRINEFAVDLLEQYSRKTKNADRVYCFGLQLFPLDQKLD